MHFNNPIKDQIDFAQRAFFQAFTFPKHFGELVTEQDLKTLQQPWEDFQAHRNVFMLNQALLTANVSVSATIWRRSFEMVCMKPTK